MLKPRHVRHALDDPAGFQSALHAWFLKHGRDYPWRRTNDPYQILISEVMLQQTQISTVLGKNYYHRFLAAFPDLHSLAHSDDAPLLKAWEGLGYYRRARMLRETARAVVDHHAGVFPSDLRALTQLPGIGPYTAGALRAFSFGLPAVVVDGNVIRVIARIMDFHDPIDSGTGLKQIHIWAGELADANHPKVHHSALMELGQTICKTRAPDCSNCPVSAFCLTRDPSDLPVKSRKVAATKMLEHALWLRDADGRLLLHHEAGSRRTGLWKLPVRDASQISHLPILHEHQYSITRYRVTLRIHDGGQSNHQLKPMSGDEWVLPEEIPRLAMAAPFRKVVEHLLLKI